MANIKISDLTAASVAADANEFEINEAGTSKKVTGSQIKAYVNAGDGALAAKNTVATADIDDLAVTTGKLAADAVDGTKIADDAIDSEHYAAGSIDAEHIADSAVTAPKVAGANGTSGQVLQSDGDGTMSWLTLAAGGGFSNMQVFTSPGTWTNPGNIEKVKVTVVGGGGGGGGGPAPQSNFQIIGPGGSGGGTAIEVISFPSATNVPVTIGAGGNSGSIPAGGNSGGTSSFGAYCSATGGQGGKGIPPSNAITNWGPVGGVGSGGLLNIRGIGGDMDTAYTMDTGYRFTGKGGASSISAGGGSSMVYVNAGVVNGAPAPAYGGGGGGGARASQTSSVGNGGSGAPGVVIVEY